MTEPTGDAPLTMSVPEAGKKYFDLSRDSSYRAAERGEIPTIRVGRLLRVPVRAMERLLDRVGERTGAAGSPR
jgi:excisionase family DNA binding protein